MIYLDNAATSFPKPACVCQEMDRCMGNTVQIPAEEAILCHSLPGWL